MIGKEFVNDKGDTLRIIKVDGQMIYASKVNVATSKLKRGRPSKINLETNSFIKQQLISVSN